MHSHHITVKIQNDAFHYQRDMYKYVLFYLSDQGSLLHHIVYHFISDYDKPVDNYHFFKSITSLSCARETLMFFFSNLLSLKSQQFVVIVLILRYFIKSLAYIFPAVQNVIDNSGRL